VLLAVVLWGRLADEVVEQLVGLVARHAEEGLEVAAGEGTVLGAVVVEGGEQLGARYVELVGTFVTNKVVLIGLQPVQHLLVGNEGDALDDQLAGRQLRWFCIDFRTPFALLVLFLYRAYLQAEAPYAVEMDAFAIEQLLGNLLLQHVHHHLEDALAHEAVGRNMAAQLA